MWWPFFLLFSHTVFFSLKHTGLRRVRQPYFLFPAAVSCVTLPKTSKTMSSATSHALSLDELSCIMNLQQQEAFDDTVESLNDTPSRGRLPTPSWAKVVEAENPKDTLMKIINDPAPVPPPSQPQKRPSLRPSSRQNSNQKSKRNVSEPIDLIALEKAQQNCDSSRPQQRTSLQQAPPL